MLPVMQIAETDAHAPADDAIIARVLAGDTGSFEVLMRRYNRRVYRAARAVLRDEGEAEDVVQDAWCAPTPIFVSSAAGRASPPG